jgi:hypothetical protein
MTPPRNASAGTWAHQTSLSVAKEICGQPVPEEVREFIPDAGKNNVHARSAPDGIPEPSHALRLHPEARARIGRE